MIDLQDPDCEEEGPEVCLTDVDWICGETSYPFEIKDAVPGFSYSWDFGSFASVSTASGVGPHNIHFTPTTSTDPIFPEVILISNSGTYEIRDTYNLQVRPMPQVIEESIDNPSACSIDDGTIDLSVTHQTGLCIQTSLDGGLTWEEMNQTSFTNLPAGAYSIHIRYCDGFCSTDYGIINLAESDAIAQLGNNQFDKICPGQVYSSNVAINDIKNTSVVYSVETQAMYGTVAVESDGTFTYTPPSSFCGIDQFTYKVCSPSNTCCICLLYTSPSPRDATLSRMPSSA